MGLTGLSVSRLRIGGVRDVGVVVIVVLVVGCWQVKRSEGKKNNMVEDKRLSRQGNSQEVKSLSRRSARATPIQYIGGLTFSASRSILWPMTSGRVAWELERLDASCCAWCWRCRA